MVSCDSDDGKVVDTVVWWPCTVRKPTKENARDDAKDKVNEAGGGSVSGGGSDSGGAWELHYDANMELGFESEIRVVRVKGPGTLEDVAGSGEHDDEEDKNDEDAEVGGRRGTGDGATRFETSRTNR